MGGVGAPDRRMATARADLKASRELAWTMLVLSLLQAIMVRVSMSVSVSVHHRIQMTGDENGVGGRVHSLILANWLVVIGIFFKSGFEGRKGL